MTDHLTDRAQQIAEIRAEFGPADWPAEILRLRADLADEKAAHAKTCDNFEGYSEDAADTLRELRARLDAVRNAAHFMRDDRDRLRAELEQARAAAWLELADRVNPPAPEVSWFGDQGPQVAAWIRKQAQATVAVVTCPTCEGSGMDPDDPGDYDHAVHVIDPRTIGPCPTCNGKRGIAVPTAAEPCSCATEPVHQHGCPHF